MSASGQRALLERVPQPLCETNSPPCSRLHAALPIHYRPCHLVPAAAACWRVYCRPYQRHWQGASRSALLSHHRQSPVVSDNPPPRVLASGCRCGATAELATQYLHQNTASLDLPIAYTLVLSRCLEPLKPPKPVRPTATQRYATVVCLEHPPALGYTPGTACCYSRWPPNSSNKSRTLRASTPI